MAPSHGCSNRQSAGVEAGTGRPRAQVRGDGLGEPSAMAGFGIFFSLFGLLLGLSLAVVVAGFARLLKTRPTVWPGWLITLLGIFIMLDVTSFWSGAWRARERMVPEYGHLFLGMVVISVYYLAASMVFPEKGTTSEDFDAHYFEN